MRQTSVRGGGGGGQGEREWTERAGGAPRGS